LRLFSFGGHGLALAALARVVFGAYGSYPTISSKQFYVSGLDWANTTWTKVDPNAAMSEIRLSQCKKKTLNSDATWVKSLVWKKNRSKYSLWIPVVSFSKSALYRNQKRCLKFSEFMIGLKFFSDQWFDLGFITCCIWNLGFSFYGVRKRIFKSMHVILRVANLSRYEENTNWLKGIQFIEKKV